MAAFRVAVQSGLDPDAFWRLTPYLTRQAVSAAQDNRTILAYQIAGLSRQKKLPKLETLLTKAEKRSMNDLKNMLKGINNG